MGKFIRDAAKFVSNWNWIDVVSGPIPQQNYFLEGIGFTNDVEGLTIKNYPLFGNKCYSCTKFKDAKIKAHKVLYLTHLTTDINIILKHLFGEKVSQRFNFIYFENSLLSKFVINNKLSNLRSENV